MKFLKTIKNLFASKQEEEVWKEILGTNGQYFISNLARFKSVKKKAGAIKELILKSSDAGNRMLCRVSIRGKARTYKLHRLVARAFVPNPNDLEDVGFKDDNYKNCLPDNLYWRKRNAKHPNHAKKQFRKTAGEKNANHKLKDVEAQNMYDEAWAGLKTQYEVAQKYNISGGYVSEVKNHKKRKHLHDGK